MIKIELSKRTYIELYIYGLYILVIGFLIKKIIDSGGENGNLFFVIIGILATLRLVPVLSLKRHRKCGELKAEEDFLSVENDRLKESFKISQVNNLQIKLRGFDGQVFYKHMNHLRPQDMEEKQLVNGLGNFIRFNHHNKNYKFELYFDNETEYTRFKELTGKWKDNNPDISLNIIR